MDFERMDEYAGLCEELSNFKRVNSKLCVCKPISQMKKKFLNRYRNRFQAGWADQGKSCDEFCKSNGTSCVDYSLVLFNDCASLQCDKCLENRNEKLKKMLPLKQGNICLIDKNFQQAKCSEKDSNISRFCACWTWINAIVH